MRDELKNDHLMLVNRLYNKKSAVLVKCYYASSMNVLLVKHVVGG